MIAKSITAMITTSILTILLLTSGSFAQSEPDSSSSQHPCDMPEMRQFGFWLGHWNLTWADSGRGTNSITAEYNNCIIMERFDGHPSMDYKGMSLSTFKKNTGKWHQTWVDDTGAFMDFTGEFMDSVMTLSRVTEREGVRILQRMRWFNIEENSLDWAWERSEDDGKTWKILWQIKYERAKKL